MYGQHLVAREKKFYEAEGVSLTGYIVPGGGAKVVRALASGQAMFAVGDASHPLRIIEQGRDAGVARDHNGVSNGSMGLDAADFDGSGRPALWVTNFENELHALYRNLGRGDALGKTAGY